MRLKKKLLRAVSCTVATAAVTAMLLTGCGGGGSAPAASSPSNEPPASSTTKPDNSSSSSSSSSSSESPSSSSIEEPEKPTDGIEWKYTDNKNGTATLTGYNKSGQKSAVRPSYDSTQGGRKSLDCNRYWIPSILSG